MAAARKPETPEANTRAAETPEERKERIEVAQEQGVDIVAVPSIDKNGEPDQTPGFKVLGEDVEIDGV